MLILECLDSLWWFYIS